MTDTPRTITLHLNAVDVTELAAVTGHDKLNAAIGYLSQWNQTYPRVNIYRSSRPSDDPELLAVYSDEANTRQYAIGAVWHDDHFGFHS